MLNKISTIFAEGKTDSLKNRLIKGAVGSFGLKIVGTALTFVTSLMFARILGANGVGIYNYAITWTNLLSIIASLGLPHLVFREVAIYRTSSAWGLMRGLLNWSNRIALLASIGLACIAGYAAWNFGTEDNFQVRLAICVALVSLPLSSFRSLKLATIRGLNRVLLGQLPDILIAPLLLILLTSGGYLVLGEDFNAVWVVAIYVVATGITSLIGIHLLHRILPKELSNAVPQYQISKWLRSSLSLVFLGAMHSINSQTDVLMLGTLKGTEAVGIYAVVNRLASPIVFILMASNNILGPTIVSLYTQNKMKQLQQVITKSSRAVFVVSLVFASSVIGFSYWLLLLFGSDFTQGQTTLSILGFGKLVSAAMGPVALILTMTGHENYTAMGVGLAAILNVILNALLIPHWGIEGAATATASSTIIWNLISFIWLKKKLGINSTALGNIR